MALLISYNLLGLIDSSIPPPSTTIYDAIGRQFINPLFSHWLRVDQMLSGDMLVEVKDLVHSY